MESRLSSHLLGNLTIFVTLLLLSSTLLLIAIILWLAHLLGSLIGAMLIVGGATGVVAIILYCSKVRPEMKQLREEMSTIYEVASIVRSAYRWMASILSIFESVNGTKRGV
ncbi:MAG: hypothetical protein R3Y68_06415 [Rikenellaceae bacterium]